MFFHCCDIVPGVPGLAAGDERMDIMKLTHYKILAT